MPRVTMAFTVTRSSGAMVRPCEPTPSGTLHLSVIDVSQNLRVNVPTLFVYPYGGSDAAKIFSNALSKALVPYYPLAGRLKEAAPYGKLQVDCTGEGVWFIDATTSCTLRSVNYFQDMLEVPHDVLLPTPPEAYAVDPLLQIQVTCFGCGGFAIGITICHTVCDGLGTSKFLNAVGEYARGFQCPTIAPMWHRDAITAPAASLTCTRKSVDHELPLAVQSYELAHASIFIPVDQISKLKNDFLVLTGKHCSTFDVMVASIWRQRTRAIGFDKDTKVKLVVFGNAHPFMDPPLPKGFYGNCFFPVTVTVSSGWLVKASNTDVVKLVKEAKARVPAEYTKWLQSTSNQLDDPYSYPVAYTTLLILDWSHLGYEKIDYGWGHAVHVLPARNYSDTPIVIAGSPPVPKKGVCLTTWCVNNKHIPSFVRNCGEEPISRL